MQKVKVTKIDGDMMYKNFIGRTGVLSGVKGASGKTERVDFTEPTGTALYLTEDQYELVSA